MFQLRTSTEAHEYTFHYRIKYFHLHLMLTFENTTAKVEVSKKQKNA